MDTSAVDINIFGVVRRYVVAVRSGNRERPAFASNPSPAPDPVPDDYAPDLEGGELELPEDQVGELYLKALVGAGIPLPVVRRAALRGELKALAAAHLQTEEDLLEVAEEASELPVTLAVAQNSAATEEVYLRLLSGPALRGQRLDPPPLVGDIGVAILDNPACTQEVMERMTSPFSGADFRQFKEVEKRVAASSRLTKKLASRITSKAAARVCAQNSVLHFLISADPTLLSDELGYHVQRALVRREEASEELLRSAASNGSKGLRKAAAEHDNLPEDALRELKEDDMLMVRRALSARDDLPIRILKNLAEDPHPMVRQTVAYNESCPEETVIRLAEDAAGSVRAAAASQLERPEKLAELTDDTRVAVRKRVAGNSMTPESELYSLAFDDEREVRTAVAQNEASPPSLLSRLGVMDLFSVRLGVAGNRSTPPETLRKLVEDQAEEHKIRRVAQATLQTQASLQQKQAG